MDRSILNKKANGSSKSAKKGTTHPLTSFLTCDAGSTAIEYAIMIAGIALLLVSVVYALGGTTLGLFEAVQGAYDLVMN